MTHFSFRMICGYKRDMKSFILALHKPDVDNDVDICGECKKILRSSIQSFHRHLRTKIIKRTGHDAHQVKVYPCKVK